MKAWSVYNSISAHHRVFPLDSETGSKLPLLSLNIKIHDFWWRAWRHTTNPNPPCSISICSLAHTRHKAAAIIIPVIDFWSQISWNLISNWILLRFTSTDGREPSCGYTKLRFELLSPSLIYTRVIVLFTILVSILSIRSKCHYDNVFSIHPIYPTL